MKEEKNAISKEKVNDVEILLAEAKKLQNLEKERARDLYKKAARILENFYNEKPSDEYLASRLFYAKRRAGEDPYQTLRFGREILEKFPKSVFIRAEYAWLCRELMDDGASLGDTDVTINYAAEIMEQIVYLKDPQPLCHCVLKALRSLVKRTELLQPQRAESAKEISRFLKEHGFSLENHLSGESKKERRCSPLELFYFLARLVGKEAQDWELIEEFIGRALEKYPHCEWFLQVHVESGLHVLPVEEAVRRAERYFLEHPRYPELAASCAKVMEAAGNLERAMEILKSSCLRHPTIWNWQRLGVLYEKLGKLEEAVVAFKAGLALHRKEEAGKVWKLHFQLARLALALGNVEEAAREAWLSQEARKLSGWSNSAEQEIFFEENKEVFSPYFEFYEAQPQGEVRTKALEIYRQVANSISNAGGKSEQVLEGVVKWYDKKRGFGFVKLSNGREAIIRKNIVENRQIQPKSTVFVKIRESLDRKRNRLGWEVYEMAS